MCKPFIFTMPVGSDVHDVAPGTTYSVTSHAEADWPHVVITVHPSPDGNASLTVGKHSETDEGYHRESIAITQDDDGWIVDYYTSYRDCDGPGGNGGTYHSKGGLVEGRDTSEWVPARQWQRDAFAESMGY